MLKAKFSKMGKSGTLAIYEVQGTSTELADYVTNQFKNSPKGPAFKSTKDGVPILDANGQKPPLLFTAYPMPGINLWHPMYHKADGTYTLDKQELQFEALVAKSMGADLGQAIAQEMAHKYTSSAPVTQSLSALSDDDDDTEESEDSSDDTTSASAAADMTKLANPAKAGK